MSILNAFHRIKIGRRLLFAGLAGLIVIVTTAGLALAEEDASPVSSLAAGSSHTCVLVDGAVRCWGYLGTIGVPQYTDRSIPVAVSGLPAGVRGLQASSTHTCVITPSNGVMCWGLNLNGQVGDGTSQFRQTPVNVTGLGGAVSSLGLGYSHTCAVLSSGGVQCWGLNANYQVGLPSGSSSWTPVDVAGLSGVRKVVGGGAHTCALLNSGALKCWGYNYYGSLGNGQSGSSADTPTPQDVVGLDHGVLDVAAGNYSTCALLESGQVKCWGLLMSLFTNTPQAMAGLESGVTALTMGVDHLCTLHTGGQVKCLGSNGAGELGDGTNVSRITSAVVPGFESGASAVEAGLYHTCTDVNGRVWCWGSDGSGQLGIGTATWATRPWPVVALSGQTLGGMTSSNNYACAFTTGGALYCWGLNGAGSLGIGEAKDMSYSLPQPVNGITSGTTQVAAGANTCAVVNGAAWCWGRNNFGQLGNGTREDASTPSQVSGLSGVSKVSVVPWADQPHSCAVANGGAWCWGGNYVGQLGNGQSGVINGEPTPQQVVGLAGGVTDIAAGGNHSCAVVNGAAQCWGSAYYGQLGNGVSGVNDRYTSPVAVTGLSSGVTAIATGVEFSCAVVNGSARCWGRNDAGQLGDGSLTNHSTPGQVSGLTSGVTAISTGEKRACAVKGGEVYCWGGTVGSVSTPYKISDLSGVTQVSPGYDYSCALNAQGMSCWGSNQYGQLGDGRTHQNNRPTLVLGFGPQPELRINHDTAAPGSPLRLVGANFPANELVLLKANGNGFCTVTNGPDGFFPAVLLTGGAADGYYEITAIAKGVRASTSFNLVSGGTVHPMQGGGPTCALAGGAEPTPAPTPTTPPGVVQPAPVVKSIQPEQGDASLVSQVEIYGSNFQVGAIARLGTINAIQTSFVDSTHLTAHFPGGLVAGIYDVSVLNPGWSKGTLAASYTAMTVDPVSPTVQDDLYGYDYELTSENFNETVGQATKVWFTLRRLGGSAALNNITVRFYVGAAGLNDPASQGTLINSAVAAGLKTSGWQVVSVNWTPAQAGSQELYAVIDPQNAIAELDNSNNLYHNWVQVQPAPPVDSTPPVVTSVTGPDVVYTPHAEILVQASDAGGSGVAWVDYVVWEYFPAVRAWLVTQDSGWRRFQAGSVNHYSLGMDYFSGPRWVDVWVADGQENLCEEPGSVIVNYIEPDSFVGAGESNLFLFERQTGETIAANLTNQYSTSDADLYIWPPDYPTRPYWYSANDAGLNESLNVTAPVAGFYWLEVYGYDFAFYDLAVAVSLDEALPDAITAAGDDAAKTLRNLPLATGDNIPSQIYRLSQLARSVFLPLLKR